MKPEEYPIESPKGIFHFPQGIMCLKKEDDTGKESVNIIRISGDEFEFEITPKNLTEAEQKDFPIRICEYEKLTEEDKKPKEIIKSEKKVDITKDPKQTVKIADGELLKIGNTITYTAGTNLITLDDSAGAGDSWGTAYDMEDVLSNCGAVVTKQGANAYDVSARLKFLSGVYFVSKSEFVELKPNPINPAYTIQIDSGAHVRFGEYNSSDKYSYNGSFWRIYTNGTTGGTSGNVIYGEFLQYGSNIWNDAGSYFRGIHFKAGATIRQYNSIMTARSYFWATDHDLQDVKWYQPPSGHYAMLIASGFDFNWAGLTTMGCRYGVFFSGTTTSDVDLYAPLILDTGSRDISLSASCNWLIRIINPVVHPTSIAGTGSGKPGCQICYTFNIKVVDTNGAGVVGATVELKDKNSDVVFTGHTISGGVLANDKIVKTDWYKHADQGGHLTYNDHTLKVNKGADVVEYNITIDHQIKEDIVLLPKSTATYDNIMAGITDIKGTGFVKDTDSLVDIRPETDKINKVLWKSN